MGGVTVAPPLSHDDESASGPPLKAGQFSIATILGAMVIVGAVLAVFRLSLWGGSAFSAIVLPALIRAFWAESLRKQAGASGAQGNAVRTYFISLAIVIVCAGFSLSAGSVVYLWASLGFSGGEIGGPAFIALAVSTICFLGLLWLSRPRLSHFLT